MRACVQLRIKANATEVLLCICLMRWGPLCSCPPRQMEVSLHISVTVQFTADLAVLALVHMQTWRIQVVEYTLFCTAKRVHCRWNWLLSGEGTKHQISMQCVVSYADSCAHLCFGPNHRSTQHIALAQCGLFTSCGLLMPRRHKSLRNFNMLQSGRHGTKAQLSAPVSMYSSPCMLACHCICSQLTAICSKGDDSLRQYKLASVCQHNLTCHACLFNNSSTAIPASNQHKAQECRLASCLGLLAAECVRHGLNCHSKGLINVNITAS